MVDIPALIKANQSRWDKMVIDPAHAQEFKTTAERLCIPENKTRFQALATRLQTAGYQPVPWFVIAVIAEREYGGPQPNGKGWDKQLGQGDPLHEKSTHVPAGCGPYLDHPGDNNLNNAWVRCGIEALTVCAPHLALWNDWSAGGTLTILEEMNGLGYAMRGVPSAYDWSGTNQYVSGKFVADHVYRPSAIDVQEGCAGIIKYMMLVDKSITFDHTLPITVPPSHPVIATNNPRPMFKPIVAKGSLVEELLAAFWRL